MRFVTSFSPGDPAARRDTVRRRRVVRLVANLGGENPMTHPISRLALLARSLSLLALSLVLFSARPAAAQSCVPGTSSDTGDAPCTPCDVGHYQPSGGQTTCPACDPGGYTSATGQT